MQLFEILLILSSVSLLLTVTLGKKKWQTVWLISGVGVLLLHLLFETARWQMGFCYLVFFVAAIALLKSSQSILIIRLLGLSIGMLLIGLSGFYAHYMPIIMLPEPSGNFTVGNTNFTLEDRNRVEIHSNNPEDFRELFVEIWYPGHLNQNDQSVNTLWQELYLGESDIVHFFTRYMSGIDTHSYSDIKPLASEGPYPLILFNHGLQMFTSQNTLLMEELASHGYVVASVGHPYESIRVNLSDRTVRPAFIRSWHSFQQAMEWMQSASAPIQVAHDAIEQVSDSQQRIQIARNAVADSEMNHTVSKWVSDNEFVLDELVNHADHKVPISSIIDTSRIAAMGMSIGGAAAAEFCKTDRRIKAGINIDGLLYGNHHQLELAVPFLMINSHDATVLNRFLMPESHHDYYEITFSQARHADFTDMVYVWPIMKLYGQSGSIPATRMIQLTNMVVRNFLDHYLKHKQMKAWSNLQYPEIEVKKLAPTITDNPAITPVLHTWQ